MIRGLGYIKTLDNMKDIPLGVAKGGKFYPLDSKALGRSQSSGGGGGSGMSGGGESSQANTANGSPGQSALAPFLNRDFSSGTPVLLGDVADVQIVAAPRRGVADLNGEGDVVGGIVEMRYGENALKVIDGVKKKLADRISRRVRLRAEYPSYRRSS